MHLVKKKPYIFSIFFIIIFISSIIMPRKLKAFILISSMTLCQWTRCCLIFRLVLGFSNEFQILGKKNMLSLQSWSPQQEP